MDNKTIQRIFIDAPATTNAHPYEFLSGELNFPYCDQSESIKIAILISKRKTPTSFTEWSSIIGNKTPQTKAKTAFVINKEDWQNTGLIWTLPTPIFQTTPIKIAFDKNSLLDLGFRIEIYARDTVITREVPPSPELTKGATISFGINWIIATNTAAATPIVETAV